MQKSNDFQWFKNLTKISSRYKKYKYFEARNMVSDSKMDRDEKKYLWNGGDKQFIRTTIEWELGHKVWIKVLMVRNTRDKTCQNRHRVSGSILRRKAWIQKY